MIHKKNTLLIAFVIIFFPLQGQTDRYPQYSTTHYSIMIPIQSDSVLLIEDSTGLLCDSLISYSFTGYIPTGNSIIATSGGHQYSMSDTTPPALLCQLLHKY